jgi:hypothetical protein
MAKRSHLPKNPIRLVAQGDSRLLSFTMSDAAAHYGVRSDVVPKRIRMRQGGEANG